MNLVGNVQGFVSLVLGVGALLLAGFAAIDVPRHRADLFPAVGRLSKPIWMGILAVAVLVSILSLFNPLNIFNLAGVIGAGIYLADVRPKIRQISGGGRSSDSYGPYGPY